MKKYLFAFVCFICSVSEAWASPPTPVCYYSSPNVCTVVSAANPLPITTSTIFTTDLGSATTANPAITGDVTSGFYTAGAAKVDVEISGVNVVEWAANSETVTGVVTAKSFIPTSSTVPTNGMYLPGTNQLGFATASTPAVVYDANQHWIGTGGSAPTCGTGCASVASGSTDVRGQFTTNSSVMSAAITFAHPWGAVPYCVITDNSTTAVAALGTVTTGSLPVSFASSLTTVAVNYICIQ